MAEDLYTPGLGDIVLLGVGANRTVAGVFIDRSGRQVGPSWSITAPIAGGSELPVSLPTPPADRLIARVQLSGSVYLGGKSQSVDFAAHYTRYPIIIADAEWVELGRRA